MQKNCVKVLQKGFGFMKYSNLKNLFKYLSAPVKVSADESKLPPPTEINETTIEYLERVSLVGFENDKGVKIVEEAIRFADQIFEVNTDGVDPMISVLEDECLNLREDVVKVEVTKNELLSHSMKCIENYYVTPLGDSQKVETNEEFTDLTKIKKTIY